MSDRLYRNVRSLCNILLSVFVAARLLAAVLPVWSSQNDRLGIAVLLLCGLRLVFILIDLARGTQQWQRAILPSLILLALVAMFGGPQSRLLVKIAAATVEAGILLFVIYVAASRRKDDGRRLEERLIERLQLFVPLPFARFLVAELLIVRAAIGGLFRRGRGAPRGFSYVENSIFPVLPLIILFCSPVDLVLVHLVLRLKGLLWTAVLSGTDLYAVIWAYGTLLTMRARPHEITGEHLHVYKGLFGHAAIALDSIQSTAVLPRSKSPKREGHADLSLRGTSKVEIRLGKPAQVVTWFVPDPRRFLSVTVSADGPDALCRAIERRRDDPASHG
ncbi:MAG: hypothetical protein KGI68_04330 [Alphaproteobacteria bacterium]|nr:hypothetical protein [Alphaproteobacteria bacterium]